MSAYATVTGRVLGPDGLGRMGSAQFLPSSVLEGTEGDGTRDVIAHVAAGRFDSDGRLLGMDGRSGVRLVAPATLPEGEFNYTVVVTIPGDLGGRGVYRARLLADQSVDLTDILAGDFGGSSTPPVTPSPGAPLVKEAGEGVLTAVDIQKVADLGNGVLAWREGEGG